MNLFNRFFRPKKAGANESLPENTRLISLLNNWSQNRSPTNYALVIKELTEGNSFLILPTITNKGADGWTVANEDTKLSLTSVHNLDGLKVLGAFSDEKSLLNWFKTPTKYTALKSQPVFEICKENNINRIVINSGAANIFVAERSNNTKPINIKEGSTILIGAPARPLNPRILQSLISNFLLLENVLEAYQFMKSINNEPGIAIGLKLSSYSDNARKAVFYVVQGALADGGNKTFVDIYFLETQELYDRVNSVENALFYKKS
jgi:hypothetical protein